MGLFSRDRGFDQMATDATPLPDGTVIPLTDAMRAEIHEHRSRKPVEAACRMHAAMTLLKNGGDRDSVILPCAKTPAPSMTPAPMPPMQRWTDDGSTMVEVSAATFRSVRNAKLSDL